MKLAHYDKFRCTADKCNITCCQEWKISIDSKTKEKWYKMHMRDKMCIKDEELVIKLNENRKCPFLSENKLCNLVIEHGVEMIPHTCDIFPRQTHEFDNRTEYSLVSCCPEVIRLLDETDIKEMTAELIGKNYDYMYELRKLLIKVMMDDDKPSCGLLKGFYILADILDNGKSEYDLSLFKELSNAITAMSTDVLNTFEEVNELFLDIVENYREQGIYKEYLEEISQIANEISGGFDEEEIVKKYNNYQKEIGQYNELLKKYLISELFSDGIVHDSDVVELTIMFQWIAIEYVIIKHAVFLKTTYNNKSVDFSDISDYMVIISRMMGYNKEDIYEYMEACFENVIWSWGYMALIVGNR